MITNQYQQCPACGYTRANKKRYIDEALTYKTGKNKGKIKGKKTTEVTLEIGDEEFKTYTVESKEASPWEGEEYYTKNLTFAVCPECNTMIMMPHI
jgi:uncharacterized C2H2 Zn-finger protein